jgi:hypothetical protein
MVDFWLQLHLLTLAFYTLYSFRYLLLEYIDTFEQSQRILILRRDFSITYADDSSRRTCWPNSPKPSVPFVS